MNTGGPPDHASLDLPEEAPIVLVGEPKSLRGELRLHNRGDEKIVVREARVRSAPLLEATAGRGGPVAQAALSAILQPGQTQHVRLTLDIDHHTPPGEYHGELEVADHIRPVILHVTEVVRLGISPQTIVIDQPVGATVVKRVVFSNNGNIALTIGAFGRIALGEDLFLHATAVADNEPTPPLESVFGVSAHDLSRPIVRQAGFLEVRSGGEPVVLQPGEVRALDLEIRVPEQLEPHVRYVGRAPIYTSNLEFVVVPVAGKQRRPTTEPEPRERARKGGKQP